MGYIKEPYGVDFVVDSEPVTEADKKAMSKIIAHYKATGEILRLSTIKTPPRTKKKKQNKRVAGNSRH